jgi:hypothetical protein
MALAPIEQLDNGRIPISHLFAKSIPASRAGALFI